LRALHDLGVRLAVDDFGTGYSSLSYLHHFPIDSIKIDRSFVAAMAEPQGTARLVPATIVLAHALDLRVTVEGVETPEELALLRATACDEMQGYYFARPLPAVEMTAMLALATNKHTRKPTAA
jgi:EAL domain-containing protein (putative c-di-GMP-specific phosphodiesterase class I)